MAYFPNASAGECFDNECCSCIYGEKPCPIAFLQLTYNYDACNNELARKMLDSLVSDEGVCSMKKEFDLGVKQ